MKKKCVIALVIVVLSLFTKNVFAADALYRMLHADDIEQFKDDQDAIIVGEIVESNEKVYKVCVIECISGKVESNNILIDKEFQYAGFSEEKAQPIVDDFCVISVKKYGEIYKRAWYAVKADSGDYKSLKLIYEAKRFGGGDIPAIQWYINSGGVEKNFYFSSDKVFVRKPDGKDIEITNISLEVGIEPTSITPTIEKEEQLEDNTINNKEKITNVENQLQPENTKVVEVNERQANKVIQDNKDNKNYSFIIYLLFCVLLFFVLVVFIVYRLKRK